MNLIYVANPTARRPVSARHEAAPALPAMLAGLRLGVLDNGKPQADLLLQVVHEALAGRFTLGETVGERKIKTAAVPASALEHLAECGLVINGLGD